jgi:glutamyl-tRNA synthetase
MATGILDALRWLGLNWDEGPEIDGPHAPYFQSGRIGRYQAVAEQLVKEGLAYYCYCSVERLRNERETAEANGTTWKYDGTCKALSPAQVAERETAGTSRVIRFAVPEGQTTLHDAVRGTIEVQNEQLDDFILLRSDHHPTYHLSVVVDDVDMCITHVIRGDDHISNAPKHLLLFEALKYQVPVFAHVPLILGPDKKRLSKRHGATAVLEYKQQGYLPEAFTNFLALLGWSPGDDRELMSQEDLIASFDLKNISGGNAVFNPDKLDWMNGQYISKLSSEALLRYVEPLLQEAVAWPVASTADQRAWLKRLLVLLQPRVKRLTDFIDQAQPFFLDQVQYEPAAVKKHLKADGLDGYIAALASALAATTPFDELHIETTVRDTATQQGIKVGTLIHATRVAMMGRAVSPGLFEVLEILGRDRVLKRLKALQSFLIKQH